ncbi:cell division protein FtsQ/DivIB [Methylobrevis albus]|uniref:Cell division protein FtsQ n=1 Tax=Methylobrevis albus TaxID=2793297 RepID=A0A931MY42_9HYPH|nr:FtsQ-type POTRA domain-containing protein [Methylobrevis albus]MBH0236694.1 FtsQ-type POTRA domain-containing protein [Methylobrevis albus]
MRRGFGTERTGGLFGRGGVSRLKRTTTWRQAGFLADLPRGSGVAASVLWLAACAGYGIALSGTSAEVFNDATAKLGFGIQAVQISGQRETDEQEVLDLMGVSPHKSLFLYDVDTARERLRAIPWIADVSVMKLFPDKLTVTLVERVPYAIWQPSAAVAPALIDETGDIVAGAVDARFAQLPRVVGAGAERRVAEAMGILEQAPALKDRVRASVLISGRRWDVVLDNDVRLMLPEVEPGRALAEIARLQRESKLVDRDITLVDMRLADRMVVRLSEEAKEARDKLIAERIKARKKGTSA